MAKCRIVSCEKSVYADEYCEEHLYKRRLSNAVMEDYPRPLNILLVQLVELNVEEWIMDKPRTQGAEQVRETGLTENQQTWAIEIAEQIEEAGSQ